MAVSRRRRRRLSVEVEIRSQKRRLAATLARRWRQGRGRATGLVVVLPGPIRRMMLVQMVMADAAAVAAHRARL